MKYFFTSESVTDGHPDKICDLISDSILDEILRINPKSKVAIEASIKDDLIFIFGETTFEGNINYSKIAKSVLKKIGYSQNYQTLTMVGSQSEDIFNIGEQGHINTGDQRIMFGYATDETESFMPMPIHIAHKLTYGLKLLREKDKRILPNGKSQVTIEYSNGIPIRVDSIVLSTMHAKNITHEEIKELLTNEVILPNVPKKLIDTNTSILINPSCSFTIGGSFADSGTTGRKIVCDSYGGMARVGEGCFSSNDPSKVDRSAAYYCRYVAKNIVAHGFAKRCEIQVAYSIGYEKILSMFIETFGSESCNIDKIYQYVNENFDFSISNMISELDLYKPIYSKTTNFGHFGREGFTWEKIKN